MKENIFKYRTNSELLSLYREYLEVNKNGYYSEQS